MSQELTIEKPELPTTIPELCDLTAELWVTIAEEKDRKEKVDLILDYNVAAEALNKLAKRDMVQIITVKTKVKVNPEKEQDIPKAIKDVGKKDSKRGALIALVKDAPVLGKIDQIIALHKAGKSNKQIVDAGFNKSTVNRQVSEYKKRTNG